MELRGAIDPALPLLVVAVHEEAEYLDSEFGVLVVGIGKVAATSTLLEVLIPLPRERRPRSLLNIGTAGALRQGLSGPHVVGTVIQHDLDSVALAMLVGEDPAPALELGQGPTLATGDRFVADRMTRDSLAGRADLVDMEGYAVARVGLRLGIPVTLLKHVSDDADEGAAISWMDSVAMCSAALSRRLAEGLPPPICPRIA